MSILSALGIMSKEEKELMRKMAIRSTMNEIAKCNRSLEEKKKRMLNLALDAKNGGMEREFMTAKNALIAIMKYSQMLKSISLRMEIAETMRDMSRISVKAIGSLGDIGKELSGMLNSGAFIKSQAAFEMGSMKMEQMMNQMDDIFGQESSMPTPDSESSNDWDMMVSDLIENTAKQKADPMNDVINSLYSELGQNKSSN